MCVALHHPQMNLRECVEIMQETFVEHFFLSQENIEKTVLRRNNNKRREVTMPATRAVEPLERCRICTLRWGVLWCAVVCCARLWYCLPANECMKLMLHCMYSMCTLEFTVNHFCCDEHIVSTM